MEKETKENTKEKTKTQKCLDWILMMDGDEEKETKEKTKTQKCLNWILMVSASPIAFLLFMLMALFSLLRFLFRASLLFIIVAINTPFALMYNMSLLMFQYNRARLQNWSAAPSGWNWSDPRASVGIEVQVVVSDFIKVVAPELLLVLSTGIITFYTAPRLVFYISTAVWLVAIFHKWLNTNCLSKIALSCLCDGYGLSPLMFLFSFIGLFDIGCHPVAKCSFPASKAFLFVKDDQNLQIHKGVNRSSRSQDFSTQDKAVEESDIENLQVHEGVNRSSRFQDFSTQEKAVEESDIENLQVHEGVNRSSHFQDFSTQEKAVEESDIEDGQNEFTVVRVPCFLSFSTPERDVVSALATPIEEGPNKLNGEVARYQFNGAEIIRPVIEFSKWNAFERGLFQLSPRINFDIGENGKVTLKSFMVLSVLDEYVICDYPVERLELPEDYSKANELYNFLDHLSTEDGFVTDKMGGRYEHSLTLLEIVEGVEENSAYRIMKPKDAKFVVAVPSKKSE